MVKISQTDGTVVFEDVSFFNCFFVPTSWILIHAINLTFWKGSAYSYLVSVFELLYVVLLLNLFIYLVLLLSLSEMMSRPSWPWFSWADQLVLIESALRCVKVVDWTFISSWKHFFSMVADSILICQRSRTRIDLGCVPRISTNNICMVYFQTLLSFLLSAEAG